VRIADCANILSSNHNKASEFSVSVRPCTVNSRMLHAFVCGHGLVHSTHRHRHPLRDIGSGMLIDPP